MTSSLNQVPGYASVSLNPNAYDGAITDDEVGAASTLLWTCGHAHNSCYGAMQCATEELLRRLLAEELKVENEELRSAIARAEKDKGAQP